jgi:arylformamidase
MIKRQNLVYGPTENEVLDLFIAGPNTPLMVFIHGGYWRALDKDDFSWIAPPYIEAGISVAIVNYGLAPKTQLTEIVNQIRKSQVWLHTNAASLAIDAEKVVYCGHSAGGHLSSMLLTADCFEGNSNLPAPPLQGVVAISGIFDLTPLSKAHFLQSDVNLNPNICQKLSPVNLRPTGTTALVTAVGQLESTEFHRQSELIREEWGTARITKHIVVPEANHFGACESLVETDGDLFKTIVTMCQQDTPCKT